jgi:MoaA/NifB/PqqE/SkfB family radical SAM enzyme
VRKVGYITTNGTLLQGDLAKALIAHRVNKVSVSCNGITKEQYEAFHRGACFETVLDNIRHFAALAARPSACTAFEVNFIDPGSWGKRRKIREFWRQQGILNTFLNPPSTRAGLSRFDFGRGGSNSKKPDRFHCQVFGLFHFIAWDGRVHPCAHDFRRQHVLGDIKNERWEQIAGRKRDILRRGDWLPLCRQCGEFNWSFDRRLLIVALQYCWNDIAKRVRRLPRSG